MKKAILILLTLTVNSAFALINPNQITKIEGADLFCSQQLTNWDGLYAIDFDGKRVWQTSKSEKEEGLELSNVRIAILRCPNCYKIEGDLFTLKIQIDLKNNDENMPTAMVTASEASPDGEVETETFGPLECVK